MKTTETNILNVVYNSHRILIDKITEYDYNGDMATAKKICTVVRYDKYSDGEQIATPMILNVSPYESLTDMHDMAKVWIACGCPNDHGRKWTKDSLHAWVAG